MVGSEFLVGERGVAEEDLNPRGYVRVRGELWHAELIESGAAKIPEGRGVLVREVRDLTLLVVPDD